MINSIYVKNFKALKEIDLELSNLNILTGINSMGKSSLIQVLLLLRQSYLNHNHNFNRIDLSGEYCDIGIGSDALYQSSQDDNIKFKIKFDYGLPSEYPYLDFDLQVQYEKEYLTHKEGFATINSMRELSLLNNNFNYINVEHIGPSDLYLKSDFEVNTMKSIGNKGEYVVHFLSLYGDKPIYFNQLKHRKSKNLLLKRQVETWLSEIVPGTQLEYMEVPGQNLFLLKYKFITKEDTTKSFKPKNVGFGLSYVLPVITVLLSATENSLIILENPESHLHPKGQSKIGELIALTAQAGAQIIVETHSDHIINGIRVAAKKKYIDADKIKLNYFYRNIKDEEHYSDINKIKIDQDGRFDENDWPDGFLDEWDNNLLELF